MGTMSKTTIGLYHVIFRKILPRKDWTHYFFAKIMPGYAESEGPNSDYG